MMEKIYRHSLDTSQGVFVLAATHRGLCLVHSYDGQSHAEAENRVSTILTRRFGEVEISGEVGGLDSAVSWLNAFLSDPMTAGDYPGPLDPGGTPFQRLVWDCLLAIAAGKTLSYGEIARAIGSPGASRAVGAACGANPLLIFIPCHRAVGADHSLTGFGAGI